MRWLAPLRKRPVLAACLATTLVHLVFLTRVVSTDEGGFAMVARYWTDKGPYLYGPQWVDRPPLLIAVFDVAQRLGPFGIRLMATMFAVVLVATLARAARTLGGPQAASWTAWTAFALASSVLLGSEQLTGELIAASFVSLSVACLLWALRGPARWCLPAAVLAGLCSAAAVLVKQDFVDALVFAGVLGLASVVTRSNRQRQDLRRLAKAAAGFFAGLVAASAATLTWSNSHGGPGALLYACVGFRADASAVMANWSFAAPGERLVQLVELSLVSGVVYLAAQLAFSQGYRLRRLRPVPCAIAAAAATEICGVVGGGNYWPHYLIALIPMIALGAGLAARRGVRRSSWTRFLIGLAALTTVVLSPAAGVIDQASPSSTYTTGRWLAASANPSDTVVVPFTHASVIAASGLAPGYPYLWSLPIRTLDPHLSLLVQTLDGRTAPTWVVRWDAPNSWGLDQHGQVQSALETHYRPAAVICGRTVWLHRGLARQLAPTPATASCGGPTF